MLFCFADVLLTILFQQYSDVSTKRSAVVDNKPLRNYHEKVITDVVSVFETATMTDVDICFVNLCKRYRHANIVLLLNFFIFIFYSSRVISVILRITRKCFHDGVAGLDARQEKSCVVDVGLCPGRC